VKAKIPYKSNRNVVFSCKYHVVWCPKYRRRVLVRGVDSRLKEILNEVARDTNSELLELEVLIAADDITTFRVDGYQGKSLYFGLGASKWRDVLPRRAAALR